MVKYLVVLCDALCRAVLWYHSSNGTKQWGRIIKLCEQPSSNCFIVSEWDESRRGCFWMSTFCHFTTPKQNTPPPPSVSASAYIEQVHRAQWRALFSKRYKQHWSQTQTLFIQFLSCSLLHSLSPFLVCLHVGFFLSPSITPLKLHWQGSLSFNVCALKQNFKAQHQFKMSSETMLVTA